MVASEAGVEEAGAESFVDRQQALFSQGFSFSGYERDLCCLNLGEGRFLDISGVSGVDSITDGRATVFADFDDDGDTDIFLNGIQGSAQLLFRNQVGAGNGFLRLSLRGTESGRDAFGAVVRVKSSAGTSTRIKSGGSGYLAQSDPRLLFGLGGDESVEQVVVSWPSGREQRFGPFPTRSSWLLIEGEKEPRRLAEKVTSLPDPVPEEERALAGLQLRRGATFPSIEVQGLDGEPVLLTEGTAEHRFTLINLWATWCVNCRHEMPVLAALQEELGSETLRVIGLSLDRPEDATKIEAFVADHEIPYSIRIATEQAIEKIFAGEQVIVPLSFLLDGEGMIVETLPGWSPAIERQLRAALGVTDEER